MLEIQQKYYLIDKIIDSNVYSNKITPSKYNIITEYGDKYILFNTFTRGVLLLEKNEIALLTPNELSNIDVCKSTIDFLIKNSFLVDACIDETERYFQFYNTIKSLNRVSEEKNTFKIYTTMNCNARCFYCFEKGASKDNMSPITTDSVIEYILKNKYRVLSRRNSF